MLKPIKNSPSILVLGAILASLTAAAVPTLVASAILSPALARGGGDNGGGRGGGDDSGGRGGHGGDGGGRGRSGDDTGRNDDRGSNRADDAGRERGRGADDHGMGRAGDNRLGRGTNDGVRIESRSRTQTRDQHQTRTRSRGADHVADMRQPRGREADDPAFAADDKGGRVDRDNRFKPRDDRRMNGQ